MRARRIAPHASDTCDKIIEGMFKEAKRTPGALKKYELLAEEDERRYAEELRSFRNNTERSFDEQHGLLPNLD